MLAARLARRKRSPEKPVFVPPPFASAVLLSTLLLGACGEPPAAESPRAPLFAAPDTSRTAADPTNVVGESAPDVPNVVDAYKPRSTGESPIDPYLAPWLHVASGESAPLPVEIANGEPRSTEGAPTVYFEETLEDEERTLTFAWFRPDASGAPRAQGVRYAFGADGVPAAFEVLASEPPTVFVSRAVEDAALARHGEPLAGRRFAVESDTDAVRVPGIVADGPVSMGPFVYQAAGSTEVTHLHCRCSPGPGSALGETREYELVPLGMLAGTGLDDLLRRESALDHLRLP